MKSDDIKYPVNCKMKITLKGGNRIALEFNIGGDNVSLVEQLYELGQGLGSEDGDKDSRQLSLPIVKPVKQVIAEVGSSNPAPMPKVVTTDQYRDGLMGKRECYGIDCGSERCGNERCYWRERGLLEVVKNMGAMKKAKDAVGKGVVRAGADNSDRDTDKPFVMAGTRYRERPSDKPPKGSGEFCQLFAIGCKDMVLTRCDTCVKRGNGFEKFTMCREYPDLDNSVVNLVCNKDCRLPGAENYCYFHKDYKQALCLGDRARCDGCENPLCYVNKVDLYGVTKLKNNSTIRSGK